MTVRMVESVAVSPEQRVPVSEARRVDSQMA
jgi:hypothetical protein